MLPMLAGVLGPLGVPELLIILVVIVIIFGVGRLPEVGGAIGRGIREFRKATREEEPPQITEARSTATAEPPPAAPAEPAGSPGSVNCKACGAANAADAKFCKECGASLGAAVS